MNFPEFLILLTADLRNTFQGRQLGNRQGGGGTQTDFGVAKTLPPATQPLASNWRIRIVPQPANFFAGSRLESGTYCVPF